MKHDPVSDVEKYIAGRKGRDSRFAKGFEEGWEVFRLGAMLAALREREGLTQAELARRVGTARSNICRWERKPSNMTLGTLAKLTAALGQTPSIMLKRAA
ncbi:MAG: helix-turn-helix transcriptional regulator [Methylacidiphilales bacterium]|nr:helix-turn-helix transcriptional regulator [Candidatus Methylacidiphilales bacterium]